jgi:hypothetical protein
MTRVRPARDPLPCPISIVSSLAMPAIEFFPRNFPNVVELSTGTTVALAIRYVFSAGLAWLLAYWLFKNRWFHRKVVPRYPPSSEVRRAMAYSASSVVVFGIVGALTVLAARSGWTQMYWRTSEYGWGWFWASIAIAILLHDNYFNIWDRLMGTHHAGYEDRFREVTSRPKRPSVAVATPPGAAVDPGSGS